MTSQNKSQKKGRWFTAIVDTLTGGSAKQQNEVNKKKSIEVSAVKAIKPVSEPIKPEEKKSDRVIKRRQRLKLHTRLCLNCQQIFEVSRRDAKYCSGSCRKTASLNGDNLIDYGNAADQFYKKLMLKLLEEILGYNNSLVTLWQVSHFIGWIDIGEDLFLKYLSTHNHLKDIIHNELYYFLKEIFAANNNGNTNRILLQIPDNYVIRWQELVDRLKSKKVELDVTYMGIQNRNT